MTRFQDALLEATSNKPSTLLEFMFIMDRLDRRVPTREELQAQIARLLESKVISHLSGNHFVRYDADLPLVPFEGIAEPAYQKALAEYQGYWEDFRKKGPEPPSSP